MNFDEAKHIVEISDKRIDAVIKPAFNFFEDTPYCKLSELPKFNGAGVYALYLSQPESTCYKSIMSEEHPIYVGKAVPGGSRQGKRNGSGAALKGRIQKHIRSLEQVENLSVEQFRCRFMIMGGRSTDMIGAMESYLIRIYNPLWNSYIDGFGINAPGAGRYNQSPSEWDTLHPGRYYAKQLTGEPRDRNEVMEKIKGYKLPVRSRG